MSHNLTPPSSLPLTTFFPFRDNAMVHTSISPSRQSSPICLPLFKFHTRSEPSTEQVIIRSPPGRCIASLTESACPSNFWQGVIAGPSFLLTMGEDILAQLRLSFHPTNTNSLLTKIRSSAAQAVSAARHKWRLGRECTASLSGCATEAPRYHLITSHMHILSVTISLQRSPRSPYKPDAKVDDSKVASCSLLTDLLQLGQEFEMHPQIVKTNAQGSRHCRKSIFSTVVSLPDRFVGRVLGTINERPKVYIDELQISHLFLRRLWAFIQRISNEQSVETCQGQAPAHEHWSNIKFPSRASEPYREAMAACRQMCNMEQC
ncbi:uncharacterized protein F5891DRAFT_478957 [Suillus fuscotomentosus]|uniref:Uncharacterized protein n=1 Tax=Suillus fuscotomentosus TaxID=1912939 RepID=A0AAD4HS58_9AGAM|nr:uncharacterized protein F5891DRAFT_478957 [Suillus fuscotomentosus]KAG1906777.1 hypothetical protein F5891DRAFT_478957 [Suillus fuscotomentosus]